MERCKVEIMYSAVRAGKNDKIEISQKIYDIKEKCLKMLFSPNWKSPVPRVKKKYIYR